MRKGLIITLLSVITLTACVFASSNRQDSGGSPAPPQENPIASVMPNQTELVLGKLIESTYSIQQQAYVVVAQDGDDDPAIWWDYNGFPITRLSDLETGKTHTLKGRYGYIDLEKNSDNITVTAYKELVRAWLKAQGYTYTDNINLANTTILQSRPRYPKKSGGNLARFDLTRQQQRAIEDYVDWYQGSN